VSKLIKILLKKSQNKPKVLIQKEKNRIFSETKFLILDSKKSKKFLGWNNIYNVKTTIDKIVEWYESPIHEKSQICNEQIFEYLSILNNKSYSK
jgi:dTDP-D-glucose 4,6-dehydratase